MKKGCQKEEGLCSLNAQLRFVAVVPHNKTQARAIIGLLLATRGVQRNQAALQNRQFFGVRVVFGSLSVHFGPLLHPPLIWHLDLQLTEQTAVVICSCSSFSLNILP